MFDCQAEFGAHAHRGPEAKRRCQEIVAGMSGTDFPNIYQTDPTPFEDAWESGYLPGSGENMYDASYVNYLNG